MTDLFEFTTLARATDPDTSHEAAESISPRLRELQRLVLDFAAANPNGFTDIDLNRHFDTHASTYRTRRSELVAKGYIKDTGERKSYGVATTSPQRANQGVEGSGGGRRHVLWAITLDGLKANEGDR